MPYIKKPDRFRLDDWITYLAGNCTNCGELNYAISKLCHRYLNKEKESYKNYNEVIGVLECAKQELYRKKITPYEEIKIKENGNL